MEEDIVQIAILLPQDYSADKYLFTAVTHLGKERKNKKDAVSKNASAKTLNILDLRITLAQKMLINAAEHQFYEINLLLNKTIEMIKDYVPDVFEVPVLLPQFPKLAATAIRYSTVCSTE